MRRPVSAFVGLVFIGVIAAAPAQATDTAPLEQGLSYMVGLGLGFVPDYEGSNNMGPVPLWNLRVGNLYHSKTYAALRGTQFESNLLPHDHWRLGLVGRYLFDYENVDDSQVKRLRGPEEALMVGFTFGYDFANRPRETTAIEVENLYDALNGNGGTITPKLRLERPASDRVTLGATLSATWASDDYMSNRFGISAEDAGRSALRRYEAGAGFKDAALNLTATYALTKSWSVIAFGGYRRMLGDAADSPVVDERGSRNNGMLGTMINYRF